MWKARHVTTAPASLILIHLLVGAVFLSEGIQTFRFSDQLGAGRFLKIGLPFPEILDPSLVDSRFFAERLNTRRSQLSARRVD